MTDLTPYRTWRPSVRNYSRASARICVQWPIGCSGHLPKQTTSFQEAWFRYIRTDTSDIANLRGWLTTSHCPGCAWMPCGRARREREEPAGFHLPQPILSGPGGARPRAARR